MNRREMLLGSAIGALGMVVPLSANTRHGFVVPPEEGPHERTFMQWPVSRAVYGGGGFLKATQRTIAEIANTIAEFEPVAMLADRSDHAAAREMLSEAVELWDIPTEDLWCRDSGPIFAASKAGELAITHIQFNGWGEKQVHLRDGQVAALVARELGLDLLPTGLKGEGGGIEQDGHGRLMAHESSWVNDNRNPGLSRAEVQERLLNAYGADQMIWSDGLWGEDITDYHIDALARFTGPGQVLMNLPEEPDLAEPFHRAALQTHDRLIEAGLELEVIPEPTSRRVASYDFVASYVNYYVCNSGVVASEFGDDETDALARDAIERHYPGRDIVMLNTDILGELGGGIHCATQQMPKV